MYFQQHSLDRQRVRVHALEHTAGSLHATTRRPARYTLDPECLFQGFSAHAGALARGGAARVCKKSQQQ
jgi:hypothetical protein